jgi:hypothetical protein
MNTESNEMVSSVDDFLEFVSNLYGMARSYGGDRDPSMLVLDYLRHEEYANYQWNALVGDLDKSFVRRVGDSGIGMIRSFRDPVFGFSYKASHFGASCRGASEYGKAPGISTNRGDVATWGGDWITFYGDWRREHGGYSSGYDYCQKNLMKADKHSTFMLSDLVEDADAYNIGMQIFLGGNISDAARAAFQATPRVKPFFQNRFGDEVTARAIAKDMLMPGEDEIVNLGRIYLVEAIGGIPTLLPHMLPEERIDEFCRGFADVLLNCVDEEGKLLENLS